VPRRKGTAKEQIMVVSVEAADWPDTSLVCPEPGGAYPPIITPGYSIVLSCGGQTYKYHSDCCNRVVYCERY